MKKVNLNEVKNKTLPVFLLILLLVGGSYAWFNYVKVGDKTQVVRAGKYSFKLEECENDIILKNAVPESAKKGLEEDVCTFRVQNTGSVSGEYTVYLDDEELEEKEKRMNDSFVRYSLVKGDEEESEEKTKLLTTTGTNPERVMATGTLNKGEEDVYHLKVWIDSEATNEVMSTIFYGKLRVKIDQTTKQTVTINPNGGVYNNKKENTVIAKKTGETVEIVGEPEREGYEFAGWEIEEGTVITGNIITVGKKNITLKAKWNVSKDAVARINDNYYTSLEKALEAAKETGDTIVMVKDTSESVVNQKDVTLDLENHTVTSKEEQTIINNGTLRVIKSGTIENTNKKVIVNNGVLILGEDDSEVSQKNPYIKGSELGIEQKGTMKFYDGLVEAKVGITGEVNEVAEGHYVFVDHDDQTGNQKVYLVETLTKAVVKTNGTIPIYYFNLQDAINTTTITQEKIEAIRNFEAAYELAVKADTNIGIDIKGYTVETGNKITNEGNLTIKDTGSEKGVLKPSVSITNNGKLIFEGIAVEETTDVNVVENNGNLEINSSTITAKGGYVVNNKENGVINSNDSGVIKGTNGIKVSGTNTIKSAHIELTSSGYGIYGVDSTGNTIVENISIVGTSGTGIRMDAGNIVINDANVETGSYSIYMYNYNATGTINGGKYTSKYRTITTVSKDLKINGGSYISSGSDGIYISGGTTTVKSAVIDGKSYGINIYNTNNVTLNIGDDDNNIDGSSPVIKGETYGVYYINGKVNFYDGIVKGQTASFNKTPTSLAANSAAIEDDETIDEKIYQVTYLTPDVITIKNGEKEYKNIQTAIDEASNNDELEVINNITAYYNITVPNDKNITIDTNGYTLNCGKGIVNNGALNIKNDSSNQGMLKTNTSVAVVTNNGNLSITNNKIMNDKTSTVVVENKGSLTTNSVDISSIYYGIGNSKNADLTLTDTNITSNSYALHNNSGTVDIDGGTYTSLGYSIYNSGSINDEVTTSKVIATGIVLTGRIYNSNATTEIDNSNVEYSYNDYNSYSTISNTNGVLRLIYSNVNIDSMYTGNNGTTNPNAIYTSNGDLTIKSLSLIATGNRKYNQIVSGIKIDSKTTDDNTILIDDVTTNISSKQQGASVYITGGANSSDIQIKNAKFNVNEAVTGYGIYETSTSNDFNVNLISGNIYTNATTAYGVYVDSGSLTMGIKDGDGSENTTVDKENPFVKAVGTTGIGVKKNNGYFKYYDGKIMGSTNAKPDTTTDTEYNYEAVMHQDQETGYEYCVLEYMK